MHTRCVFLASGVTVVVGETLKFSILPPPPPRRRPSILKYWIAYFTSRRGGGGLHCFPSLSPSVKILMRHSVYCSDVYFGLLCKTNDFF